MRMGRKDNVTRFDRSVRRCKPAIASKRHRIRWRHRRRLMSLRNLSAFLCVAVLVIPFAALQIENPIAERFTHEIVPDAKQPRVIVSWVDGDSGSINGRAFRLYGVDAPEGSESRARCDVELRRANDARHAVRSFTTGRRVVVRRSHGFDKYGRELVELSADGDDVGAALRARGHLKRWNYAGGQAKPNWCS